MKFARKLPIKDDFTGFQICVEWPSVTIRTGLLSLMAIPHLSSLKRLAVLAVLVSGVACSSSDLSDMEQAYPNLVDIPPRPEQAEGADDKEQIIEDLRREAEARKDEGYQAPE